MTAPPPTDPDPWLSRVESLLAKAESSEFPAEAEAFFAKAQALMARHTIDDAMLAARGRRATDPVEREVVVVPAPYAGAKAALLSNVAAANGCRVVVADGSKGGQRCVVIGHASDLAKVRTLHAALSVHAVRSMVAADVPPFDTPRRFRHAFLIAFAFRIGERLEEAAAAARADAEASTGPGVALVLADRSAAVDAALTEAFPNLRTKTVSTSSAAGAQHGRAAADRAGLGQPGVRSGTRRQLR